MSPRHIATLILCLCSSPLAHAESMIPPTCTCDDECKNKWPYSGICSQIWGGKYCYFSGPGTPCPEMGIPKPDVPPKACTCNKDCFGTSAPYCSPNPAGWGSPICTYQSPGITCGEAGIPKLDILPKTCRCNDDCKGGPAPYCNTNPADWGPTVCTWKTPGISCTPDFMPNPDFYVPRTDDLPYRRDFRVPAADGDPDAAVSPRSGCSLADSDPDGTAGALPLAGLLGVALLLAVRLRGRR